MYYLIGVLMVSLFITTNCHAQTTNEQMIQVEAIIGVWDADADASTIDNVSDAGTKEKATITITPSDSGSSKKVRLPQTGEQLSVYMMLLGTIVSLFSTVMLIELNREKNYIM
ncbi:LPXTG cell wall anchor domain-containing protein [Enterococcus hirae]|uniref:LPXTG cell wall anchor domain-containing protein n=1 Tax=Enterococcus hirae TaxID=1354 RepID=UPI0032E36976